LKQLWRYFDLILDMQKVIKIFTLLSFLGITIEGEHIGGSVIVFLVLPIFYWNNFLSTLMAFGIVLTLAALAWTIFNPNHRLVKIIVPTGITILIIPFFISDFLNLINHTRFIYTFGLFVSLSIAWIAITFIKGKA
jgi:hypothetical protein